MPESWSSHLANDRVQPIGGAEYEYFSPPSLPIVCQAPRRLMPE